MSEEMQALRLQLHDAQRELATTQHDHTQLANKVPATFA
jgi:hypothetical protein